MTDEGTREAAGCQDEAHEQHLCFLMNEDFHHKHKEQFQAIVSNPEFICENCSQTARKSEYLCKPVRL